MYRSNIYLKMMLLASFFVLALNSVFAQQALEYKLQLLEQDKWGVYVRPVGIDPSLITTTGSAQVTIVMPLNFGWNSLTSVSGNWANNATVHGPIENSQRSYVSFGMTSEFPHINLIKGQETLLFTFKRSGPACPDTMNLISNVDDPFLPPNSLNSNPGNEMTTFDPFGFQVYEYKSNYSPSAWSCHDCDGDGILNAFEDTDGDGTYDLFNEDLNDDGNLDVYEDTNNDGLLDPSEDLDADGNLDIDEDANNNGVLDLGEDADDDGKLDLVDEDANSNGLLDLGEDLDSDGVLDLVNEDADGDGYLDPDVSQICNPCDPFHPESAELVLLNGSDELCAGDLDTMFFSVTIEGGWPPYTVRYTDGIDTFSTDSLYHTGDELFYIPDSSVTISLVDIVDSFHCLLDTFDSAPIVLTVHGPLSVVDQPDPVTECSGNATSFCFEPANAGDGDMLYKWQVSTNGGGVWTDIQDGGVYDNTDSLCLDITNVAGKHGYLYRAAVFTTVCDRVYSNSALLQVEGPITISLQPRDTVNCATEGVAFTATSVNAGAVGTMVYQWEESSNGTTWNNVSGATAGGTHAGFTTTTLQVNAITTALDGHYYRMKVSTGECSFVYTNAARLDVSGAITVTDDPDNISNCAGSEVNFIGAFNNAGATYPANPQLTITSHIWQIADASTGPWTNLTNATNVYTGISGTDTGSSASDTLTISNVVGLNGKWYRLAYTSSTCSTPVYSAAAQLNVSGNVSFSVDPKDATVCSGNDTTFFATASIPQGTFTFGWQFSNDNGTSWTDINFTTMAALFTHTQSGTLSSGTDILTVSNVASMYGRRFRSVANATNCNSVYSNYAILSVQGPLSVSDQPDDVTECSGNSTLFSSTIANAGVPGSTLVTWQVSINNGVSWVNLSNNSLYNGTNTVNGSGVTTLSINNVAGLHNALFRVAYRTSTCSVQFSNSARLTVEGPITVTAQPADRAACSGSATTFTSTASVASTGTLAYQWQVSSDNGTNWSNIGAGTDGGVYSNYNTTTLSVSDITGLYARCYRLAFTTGECNAVYSDRACLTIEGPIAIVDQPDDIFQCSGEAVNFIVGASNSSPQDTTIYYQWQESTDGGSSWHNVAVDTLYNGATTNQLSVSFTTGFNGNQYRCLVSTATCSQDTSSAATLNIEGPLTVLDDPDNITECSGSDASFQATISNAGPGTLIYQWEYSTNNGVSWNDATNSGNISGATGTTLVVNDVAGMNGYRWRMRYRTANCNASWTNYAVLTVEGPISVVSQPQTRTICSGNGTNFSVTTANTGAGAITYQWQVSPTGSGGPWFNLANNSNYNGVTTANLSIGNVAGFNGYCYRVNIQTSTCAAVSSNPGCLTVEGPITFTSQPANVTQCSGEGVTFSATSQITTGNAGTMSYQWQWSTDNGTNWSNIVAAGANGFANWNTTTLTVGNVVGINGARFRLSVTSGVCNQVFSFHAILTVEGPLTITTNPVDYTNCSDKEALFFSKYSNPGQGQVFKQWQYKSPSGAWTDITQLTQTIGGNTINFGGYDSDTLLVSPIIGLNGYLFRNIIWTATCNRDTTTQALLNVEGPVTFTDQPDDVTLCSDGIATYTIAINNSTGVGTVTYVWQRLVAGSWVDLTNSSPYSGVFTNQLTVSPVTGLYNSKFRCKVRTGNCDFAFSDLANLFVEGPITVNLQPTDASICSNKPHLFNTTVVNPGFGQMTYRWQYKKPGGAWTSFTANTGHLNTLGVVNSTDPDPLWQSAYNQDLNLTSTDGLGGWMFRLLITTPHCSLTTNEVTLTVKDKCLSGDCDLDNDGQINSADSDDDNDQLADYWEWWMTTYNQVIVPADSLWYPGTGPWNYTVDGSGITLPYISYNRCLIDTDGDNVLDNQEDPDGDNITNGEETDGDIVFDGNPLDPCSPILGPTCIGINLAIKVGLQGAHIGVTPSDPLMRASLRAYGANQRELIPTDEPYENMQAFHHADLGDGGGETLSPSDSIALFSKTNGEAIIDWVFVELHSSTALDSVGNTRSALLRRDGHVIDLNGDTVLHFPNAQAGTYYVAVRHRNHLGAMTGEALDLSPVVQEIDFTDPSTVVNGTNPQIQIGGRMYLWSGDLNSDGRTVYQGPGNDVLKLFTTVLYDPANTTLIANFISEGYKEADVNLDGRSIYQGPNNDRSMLLLNAILSHPANVNLISNFVILEMLP